MSEAETVKALLLGFLGIACCLVFATSANAFESPHPYHVSMAEVNWNAETKKFEVALCVWPSDLEKALGQQEGRTIDLAKEPQVDQMMRAYVAKRFFILDGRHVDKPAQNPALVIAADSKTDRAAISMPEKTLMAKTSPKTSKQKLGVSAKKRDLASKSGAELESAIKWYGHEADPKQAWLYFEVDGDPNGSWTFENRVFFELNEDQLNHVQWAGTGKTQTLVVSPNSPKVLLARSESNARSLIDLPQKANGLPRK
jgi:hypothetical protein